jgi:uncharacterized membrane protein YdjX (TVP38/TMEM64 family)
MRSALARAAALAVLLVTLGVAAMLVDVPGLVDLRRSIDSLGPSAPVVFVLIYTAAVLLPVPKSVLSAAAGLAFGVPMGIALVLTGATVGAVGAFGLARVLGRDAVCRLESRLESQLAHGQLERLDALLERHGVLAALVVRLLPVMPFTPLNYACGVTAMRLRHYVVGTVLGLIPGTSLLVVLGSAGTRLSPWALIGGSAGFAASSLTVGYLRYRRRGHHPESMPANTE